MKLTAKLVVAITVAILLVLGINALIRFEREETLFVDDSRRDSRLLGRALGGAVRRIWSTAGEAAAMGIVDDADARESHIVIRWMWVDAPGRPGEVGALRGEDVDRLRRGEELSVEAPSPNDDGSSLYTYEPVEVPGVGLAAIELRESLEARGQYLGQSVFQVVAATAILVLLCALLAAILGLHFVGRPVRGLVAQARRIGAGDLSPHQIAPRRDEIGQLASEMNAMCERLRDARDLLATETAQRLATQEQLRHADRLTTVGKLAAGIAHEVGTPLNVITGYCQLIREEYPPDSPASAHAAIIAEQAHRVSRIIRQLLDFARQRTLQRSTTELTPLVAQVVSLLESMTQKAGVEVAITTKRELTCEVDTGQIQQVLANLFVNAIQAMPNGGTLSVVLDRPLCSRPGRRDETPATPHARISIRDSGTGIAARDLPHVFEPFFTTKGVGEGTGLGLSVAYGIVEEHGGWIAVTSPPGEGACFEIHLPLGGSHD